MNVLQVVHSGVFAWGDMRYTLFSLLGLLLVLPHAAGQRPAASFTPLPNGVEVRTGTQLLRVVALSDSVLRVRVAADGKLPEDASWAVLPASRTASGTVTPEEHGFATHDLRVRVADDLQLTVSDLAGNLIAQDAAPVRWEGERFRTFKRKPQDAHYFGLGDKPGPLDRLGQSYVMWNTDSFGWQESTDPIYKSIPFFIEYRAGKALGVLFDNTWRSFFDFGHELADQYSFGSVGGALDYYLIYGPEPKQVVKGYAWLTGTSPLAPLWSLGFQQSRYSYETRERLVDVAHKLRENRIPADALYLDIDYQLKNRPFTVDPKAFPDFASTIKKLEVDKFHLVLITDLHIANLPNQGYAPFDSGMAGDHFVKNPDGSVYVGPVWPGPAVFPDFTRATTRDWWGTLYKEFSALGVSGFWNDMNEPAVFRYPTKTMPDDVQHRIDEPGFARRTASHLEIHNVFGMENSRATYDGLLALHPDERPFVLTRASYAGGQRYAATWTGDNDSSWNHLRQTTPQLLNLGLSGFAMAGADVGGFAGSPSPELLTRWLELAAFQPIDRDHAAKGTRDHEPWVDGAEQLALRRRAIEERYKLLPYIYTVAEENSRTGLPIVRPLFLEFPHAAEDGHPLDLDAPGEFFLGPDLLVAASPTPDQVAPYELHLPPGLWYDYWTGARQASELHRQGQDHEKRDDLVAARPVTLNPAADPLPVYVRAGSILPMAQLVQSTDQLLEKPITLRLYANVPGESCQGDLYLDDGHSLAYKRGDYERVHFSCRLSESGKLTFTVGAAEGNYRPRSNSYRLEIHGWKPKLHEARLGTNKLTVREEDHAWVIELPADAKGSVVEVQ